MSSAPCEKAGGGKMRERVGAQDLSPVCRALWGGG